VDVRLHYQGHAIIWEPMVEDGAGGASGESVLTPSLTRSHISIPWMDYVPSTMASALIDMSQRGTPYANASAESGCIPASGIGHQPNLRNTTLSR
jgi:hypothetical protein